MEQKAIPLDRPFLITIDSGELLKQIYEFRYDAAKHRFWLAEYTEETRATTRHKFRADPNRRWSQSDRAGSRIPRPLVYPHIADLAYAEFKSRLRMLGETVTLGVTDDE